MILQFHGGLVMRGEMELVREGRGGEGSGRGGGEKCKEKVVGLGFESRGYVVEIGWEGEGEFWRDYG